MKKFLLASLLWLDVALSYLGCHALADGPAAVL
jgi:hypothetical protein